MISNLELKSKPDLKTSVFENWLVNPSGLPGHWIEGDLYQEQLQDELYKQIGGKDAAFAEKYVQHVIAPNVHHFVHVKKDINKSLGLARRSGKHVAPHTNLELQKLMDTYQAEELHLFRSGWTYGGDKTKVDNLGKGYEHLCDSKLAAWITETTRACGLNSQLAASQGSPDPAPSTADDDVTEYIKGLQNADAEHDKDHVILTPGSI